jgi:hypothetical protein
MNSREEAQKEGEERGEQRWYITSFFPAQAPTPGNSSYCYCMQMAENRRYTQGLKPTSI